MTKSIDQVNSLQSIFWWNSSIIILFLGILTSKQMVQAFFIKDFKKKKVEFKFRQTAKENVLVFITLEYV